MYLAHRSGLPRSILCFRLMTVGSGSESILYSLTGVGTVGETRVIMVDQAGIGRDRWVKLLDRELQDNVGNQYVT